MLIDNSEKRELYLDLNNMASPAPIVLPPINALDLAIRMGIDLELLSRAANLNARELRENPRVVGNEGLQKLAALWEEIIEVFGSKERGQIFLQEARPELSDKNPLAFLSEGRVGVVKSFVDALREMLP